MQTPLSGNVLSRSPTHRGDEDAMRLEISSASSSELGRAHKSRLVSSGWSLSALPPKADIRQRIEHVCFVPSADTVTTKPPQTCIGRPRPLASRITMSLSMASATRSSRRCSAACSTAFLVHPLNSGCCPDEFDNIVGALGMDDLVSTLTRFSFRGDKLLFALAMLPLVVPFIILAVALLVCSLTPILIVHCGQWRLPIVWWLCLM